MSVIIATVQFEGKQQSFIVRPFRSNDGKIELLKLTAIMKMMSRGQMPEGAEKIDTSEDVLKLENDRAEFENEKKKFATDVAWKEAELNVRRRKLEESNIIRERDEAVSENEKLKLEMETLRRELKSMPRVSDLENQIARLQDQLNTERNRNAIRGPVSLAPVARINTGDIGNGMAEALSRPSAGGGWSVVAPELPAPRPAPATPAPQMLEID
jgi:hypothetical protein